METANTRCTIKNVRLTYMHLLEARAAAIGAEPKFSLTMLIAKTDEENVNAVKASIKAAIAKKYGETKPPKGMRNPLRDGDEVDAETGERVKGDEFAGHYYISASNKKAIKPIVGKAKAEAKAEHLVNGYHGCVGVNFYAYDAAGNRGVAAGLNDLWITKKGEPLAGGGTDWGNIEAEDFGSAGLEGLTDGEDVFQ